MIVSEIYETMAGDLYGVVLNEDIKIIRIEDCGTRQVKYTSSGRPYFNLGGQRHYIDDFIRI